MKDREVAESLFRDRAGVAGSFPCTEGMALFDRDEVDHKND